MKAAFYKATREGVQGIYSRMVRAVEDGPYSHCELIFLDGFSASASFTDGGVRFKDIGYKPDHWDILDIGGTPEQEAAARAWFEQHNGQGYDLLGNLRFAFGFVPESDGRWFCSESIAAALGWAKPYRYGPNGLYEVLARGIK